MTVEMSPTLKNGQLLDRLIELVEDVYGEPTPPISLVLFWLMKLRLNVYQMEFARRIH